MDNLEIARRRLANQHLLGAPFQTAHAVVDALGAVQAQDYNGAKWALGARMTNAREDALEQAFNAGEILRTHVLRPTWHFVTPADIRWMLELTAPRVHAFNAFLYRRMELDDAIFSRSNAALEKILRGGKHKTRAEVGAALTQNGIPVGESIRLGLLMMRAELDGIVCSGARKGKQFTYALLEERAPRAKKLKRDEALFELTRRYFATRGPATAHDFAWWSGLTVTDAKNGIASARSLLASETFGAQQYWFSNATPARKNVSPRANLLPNYDEYFIGFKDRTALRERVFAHPASELNRALSSHIVFVNGQIVGGWKSTRTRDAVQVRVHLLDALRASEQHAVERAAAAYAKFLDTSLELSEHIFDDKRETGLFT